MDFNKLFQRSEAERVTMNNRFGEYYGKVFPDLFSLPEQGEPGGWMTWAMYVSMGQRHDYRPALRQVNALAAYFVSCTSSHDRWVAKEIRSGLKANG
jgi:hypothetical protein